MKTEPKLKWKRPKKSIEGGRIWFNAKAGDLKISIGFGCVWTFSCKQLKFSQSMSSKSNDGIKKVQEEAEIILSKIISNKIDDYKAVLKKIN